VSGARWLWVSAAVIVADRTTKYAIERYTSPFFRHPVLSDVVTLVHSQNPGIAFGVFSNSSSPWLAPVLLVTAAAVMIFLVWMIVTNRAGGALAECGLALIHGGVTDFMEVRLWKYVWPAFNVADSAITIGALLLFYDLFFAAGHKHAPASDRKVG
jgi:signal peptidase II